MFELPMLPYERTALEPYISEETLSYHYGKHHQTYVDKLNGLIEGTPFADMSLEEIIRQSDKGIFNNAAQVWNHTFYWENLSAKHGQEPQGDLLTAINDTYGSLEAFKDQFTQKALTLFGSGWTWLVIDANNQLQIVQTSNADTPITQNLKPILTCDVWEHAYYLDTQNARPKYLENFWAIVNWDVVLMRYQGAIKDEQ